MEKKKRAIVIDTEGDRLVKILFLENDKIHRDAEEGPACIFFDEEGEKEKEVYVENEKIIKVINCKEEK